MASLIKPSQTKESFLDENFWKLVLLGGVSTVILLLAVLGPARTFLIGISTLLTTTGLIGALLVDIGMGISLRSKHATGFWEVLFGISSHLNSHTEIIEDTFSQAFKAFSLYTLIGFVGFGMVYAGMSENFVMWIAMMCIHTPIFTMIVFGFSYKRHNALQEFYSWIW